MTPIVANLVPGPGTFLQDAKMSASTASIHAVTLGPAEPLPVTPRPARVQAVTEPE